MLAFISVLPGWIKVSIMMAVAVAVFSAGSYFLGRRDGSMSHKIEEAKEGQKRVETLEKSNEEFRSFSERERCRALMLDSGLRADFCD